MNKQVKLLQSFSQRDLEEDINDLDPKDWTIQGNVFAVVAGASTKYIATMVRPEGYLPPEQRKLITEQGLELDRLYVEANVASDRVDAAIADDSDGYGGMCLGREYGEAQVEFESIMNAISEFKKRIIQPEK
jgi:hypothetical protein